MTKTAENAIFRSAHTYIAHIRESPRIQIPRVYNKHPHCESDSEDFDIEEMIVKTD